MHFISISVTQTTKLLSTRVINVFYSSIFRLSSYPSYVYKHFYHSPTTNPDEPKERSTRIQRIPVDPRRSIACEQESGLVVLS